jgi:hypothetical protein
MNTAITIVAGVTFSICIALWTIALVLSLRNDTQEMSPEVFISPVTWLIHRSFFQRGFRARLGMEW